jgi:hypothetical protein
MSIPDPWGRIPDVLQHTVIALKAGIFVLVLAVSALDMPVANGSEIAGYWTGAVTHDDVTLPVELQLAVAGNRVIGTAQVFDPIPPIPIQDGRLVGNKMTFDVPLAADSMGEHAELLKFELSVQGGTLRGSLTGHSGDERFSALFHLMPPAVIEKVSPYLFVWASTTDPRKTDFLAVIDALPRSQHYGQVIASLPVDLRSGMAHHTEHQMTNAGTLFANLFGAGRTYLIDLHEPTAPRVLKSFDNIGAFSHPHSFVREPNGNILVTFQQSGAGDSAPGGLAELSPTGQVLRTSSAQDSKYQGFLRPYSLTIVPRLDRVVTSCSDMFEKEPTHAVQIWRLSDLRLLKTIELPDGPRGVEGQGSAEPRVLRDGVTVLVSTFRCGLYRLSGLEGEHPGAELVHDFGGTKCAVPVQIDNYWVQPVPLDSIVSIDIADPGSPKEVSRLTLGHWDWPHWMSVEPRGRRFVLTGYGGLSGRVVIGSIDARGNLALDRRFGTDMSGEPGVSLERALPHGAVFSIP